MTSDWAEWNEIKAAAATSRTRLDGVAGEAPPPGAGVRLVVTPQMLRTAADRASEVAASVHRFETAFVPGISKAGTGMKGFASAPAFTALEERWRDQTRRLVGLLASDLAPSLRQSATLLKRGDISAHGDLMRVDPGTQG
ncbi:hypothetical protein SRB5_49950 [Streptomyces sp. RB5]|uniref:Uncharacterized protein n=1 Tax=Streptomyces smaragdinus TaxID=2585196 RepID=A0A7K0CN04_9ACTN|nr:type VII secretion target [Streptomyces smaragdinus]MQY14819.1 hypothetical protein [Streptomyces smaragdinus]